MNEINNYENPLGKSRPRDPNAEFETQNRRAFFETFKLELIPRLEAEGFVNPQPSIVGSVARGEAAEGSDIDFVVKYQSNPKITTELQEPRIRQVVAHLVKDWQQEGKLSYQLQLITNETNMFPNAVNLFKMQQILTGKK